MPDTPCCAKEACIVSSLVHLSQAKHCKFHQEKQERRGQKLARQLSRPSHNPFPLAG